MFSSFFFCFFKFFFGGGRVRDTVYVFYSNVEKLFILDCSADLGKHILALILKVPVFGSGCSAILQHSAILHKMV